MNIVQTPIQGYKVELHKNKAQQNQTQQVYPIQKEEFKEEKFKKSPVSFTGIIPPLHKGILSKLAKKDAQIAENSQGADYKNMVSMTSRKIPYFDGEILPKNQEVLLFGDEVLKLCNYTLDLTNPKIKTQLDNMPIGSIKTIGREGDIRIQADKNVSRKHLSIQKTKDGYIVIDTSMNGTKVVKKAPTLLLYNGATIKDLNPPEIYRGRLLPNIHPDELVRYAGNGGMPINRNYVLTSRQARAYLYYSMERGAYTGNLENYINTINNAHIISYQGFSGKNKWYKQAGEGHLGGNLDYSAGKIRNYDCSNGRKDYAIQVEEIARQYNDPYRVNRSSKVWLEGIPDFALPSDTCKIENGRPTYMHNYPDCVYLEKYYYKEMYRSAKEALYLIRNGADKREILAKIAQHYQYAANARPYDQINNSLFMNEVNALLSIAGLNVMPHGILDHAAQRLQSDTFVRYFIDQYKKTGIDASRFF